jgi:SAM-dependent methyltransferase
VPDDNMHANRAFWNAASVSYQADHDGQIGRSPKLWGAWSIPEDTVGAIGPVAGLRVLELGCGAAQWASSLQRDGAAIVGLDLSEAQLDAARRRSATLPLVQANAEVLPLAPASLDLVFCDHGAMSWGTPIAQCRR